MIRRAVGLTLLLACAGATPARAGSRYSLRGEGEPVLPVGADVRALGGSEAAADVPSLSSNPASLAFADRVRFYGSWVTEWIRTEENLAAGSAVRKEYDGFVPNLGLVFPLPGGLSFGTGLLVDRRQEGKIVQGATTADGRAYVQTFEASGNALGIPILVAKDLGRAQLGAGLDVLLVNSKIRWRNTFAEGSGFLNSDDRDETGLWAASWRAGARVPLGRRAALGAWGSWPRELSGRRRLENDDPQGVSQNLEIDATGETARRIGAGIDVSPRRGVRVTADWTHEAWSDVTSPRSVGTFVDVDRVAAGLEWIPASASGRRWPLRAGFRTEPLHTLDGNGREVRESAFTAGSGFSFADGRGKFDWFVEYARRGDADSEYEEQVVRFGVTLTGLEEWTRRRPPEADADDW